MSRTVQLLSIGELPLPSAMASAVSFPAAPVRLKIPSRAEHVGSLLRPEPLFKKRRELERGEVSVKELAPLEDEAIQHVLKLQKDAGISTITDGEMRRAFFFDNVFDRLEGMVFIARRPITAFKSYIPHIAMMYQAGVEEAPTVYCSGKIKRTTPFYIDEFRYVKSLVQPEEVKNIKITMCSPSWFHQRHGSDETYDLSVYKNDDEYFDDLAIAYRAEIEELYALGCRHIQVDDPTFCYFCNDTMISDMQKAAVDHEALLETYIRAINIVTDGRPDDLIVSVHTCRGNFTGGVYFSEGGYDRIANKLFNTLDVDVFYLEYDTERAGDFSPLRYMPLNKVAVLGLVTTKIAKLESIEVLKEKVEEAVRVMMNGYPTRSRETALNQLCLSTQCGFASVWEGNPLTESDQVNKLRLVVEAAKTIWADAH